MMESTRQQWRVYAIATIALIVILLLTTHLSIRLQVREKKKIMYTANTSYKANGQKKNRNASSNKLTDGRTKPCIRFHIRGYKRNTDKLTI